MFNVIFSILICLIFSVSARAQNLSCGDLQKSYAADLMNIKDWNCIAEDLQCRERQVEQLRALVKMFTGKDVGNKNSLQLISEFVPRFFNYSVGTREFEAASVELSGHPYIAFFDAGGSVYSGIHIVSGQIFVANEPCATRFRPIISVERKQIVCTSILPILRNKRSDLKFDLDTCLNTSTADKTDFFISEFNQTHMKIRVQRSLREFNGGYFSCDVDMDRRNAAVLGIDCLIQ